MVYTDERTEERMKRITKTLSLSTEIADRVQALANRERRSFTKQAEILFETALAEQRIIDGITAGKTQIDMEAIHGKAD
jgi:predicted transcriptional regulator